MARKNPAAVALGRRGGRVTSPAKTAAARRNAQRAGRKPKFQIHDRVIANDHAPSDYRGHRGVVTEVGPRRAEYGVRFAVGPCHLMSWWLDKSSEA